MSLSHMAMHGSMDRSAWATHPIPGARVATNPAPLSSSHPTQTRGESEKRLALSCHVCAHSMCSGTQGRGGPKHANVVPTLPSQAAPFVSTDSGRPRRVRPCNCEPWMLTSNAAQRRWLGATCEVIHSIQARLFSAGMTDTTGHKVKRPRSGKKAKKRPASTVSEDLEEGPAETPAPSADRGDSTPSPATDPSPAETGPVAAKTKKIKKAKVRKTVKSLSPEELEQFNAEQRNRGVLYLSRLPPYMKPAKLRHLLGQYGEIDRLYLAPEGGNCPPSLLVTSG